MRGSYLHLISFEWGLLFSSFPNFAKLFQVVILFNNDVENLNTLSTTTIKQLYSQKNDITRKFVYVFVSHLLQKTVVSQGQHDFRLKSFQPFDLHYSTDM